MREGIIMRRGMRLALLAAIVLAAGGAGCGKRVAMLPASPEGPIVDVRGDAGLPLLVGTAKEVITPSGRVYLAGFGNMRLSWGAHDDLYVRTIVFKQGREKLALSVVDVVGLMRPEVVAMKAGVSGFREDQIIIASTHTHSGPDTMGLWGPVPLVSGVDPKFIARIGQAVADTIAAAERSAVPVTAATAVYQADPTIMENHREGEPADHQMGLMVFRGADGKTVATLWTAVGHPETMWGDNHLITADYPGRVCELIEQAYGGGAVFFSGDLGAMMTPTYPPPGVKRDFARLERVSQAIFADVQRGMALLEPETSPVLRHKMSRFLFPAENENFMTMLKIGLVHREVYEGEQILTEVHVIELGSAQFVTFPGEAYPKLGLSVRARQKPHAFQIGLADDELGYILYPADYGTKLYEYETTVCAGPRLSERVEEELTKLLEE